MRQITSMLPRYSLLAVCIRAAILGINHPLVQHMIERNSGIDLMHAANQPA